jgi:hypothetical protein
MQSKTAHFNREHLELTGPSAARTSPARLHLYKVRSDGQPDRPGPAVQYILAPSLDEALARFEGHANGAAPCAVEMVVDPIQVHSLECPQCFKFVIDGDTHVVVSDDMRRAWAQLRDLGLVFPGHRRLDVVRLSERVLI